MVDLSQRRHLRLSDPVVDLAWQKSLPRCATIDEHASAVGLSAAALLALLDPHIDSGALGVETVNGRLFLHTAPQARPGPWHLPQAQPNLWERLREREPAQESHALWRLIRALEAGGWAVEANQLVVSHNHDRLSDPPRIAVVVDGDVIPLVTFPQPSTIAAALDAYAAAGYRDVAMTCLNGALDPAITAVREWGLARHEIASLRVWVLEAPRFAPTVLQAKDNAVTPLSLTRYAR